MLNAKTEDQQEATKHGGAAAAMLSFQKTKGSGCADFQCRMAGQPERIGSTP